MSFEGGVSLREALGHDVGLPSKEAFASDRGTAPANPSAWTVTPATDHTRTNKKAAAVAVARVPAAAVKASGTSSSSSRPAAAVFTQDRQSSLASSSGARPGGIMTGAVTACAGGAGSLVAIAGAGGFAGGNSSSSAASVSSSEEGSVGGRALEAFVKNKESRHQAPYGPEPRYSADDPGPYARIVPDTAVADEKDAGRLLAAHSILLPRLDGGSFLGGDGEIQNARSSRKRGQLRQAGAGASEDAGSSEYVRSSELYNFADSSAALQTEGVFQRKKKGKLMWYNQDESEILDQHTSSSLEFAPDRSHQTEHINHSQLLPHFRFHPASSGLGSYQLLQGAGGGLDVVHEEEAEDFDFDDEGEAGAGGDQQHQRQLQLIFARNVAVKEKFASKLQDAVLKIVVDSMLNMQKYKSAATSEEKAAPEPKTNNGPDAFAEFVRSQTYEKVEDLFEEAFATALEAEEEGEALRLGAGVAGGAPGGGPFPLSGTESHNNSKVLSDGGSVLKDPTVLEAEEKEKKKATASRFETLRAYLKDLSHLKRKAVKKESERSTYATSEEVADNLLEHDVTFFEPLKHLPSCAQELCRDIARDKMMQVATKLTQDYSSRIRHLEEKLRDASQQLSALTEGGGTSMGGMQGGLLHNQALLESYEERIGVLEQELHQKENALRRFQQDDYQDRLESDATAQEAKLECDMLRKQIEALEEKFGSERGSLEEKVAALKEEKERLEGMLEAKEQELFMEKAEKTTALEQKEALLQPKPKTTAELEVEAKQSEVYQSLLRDFDSLEQEFSRQRESLETLREEDKALKQRSGKQEIDLEKQRKQLQFQKHQLEEQDKSREDLQHKVEELRKELAQVRSKSRKLEEEGALVAKIKGGDGAAGNKLTDEERRQRKLEKLGKSGAQLAKMQEHYGMIKREVVMLRDALDQVHLRLDDRERKLLNLSQSKSKYKEMVRNAGYINYNAGTGTTSSSATANYVGPGGAGAARSVSLKQDPLKGKTKPPTSNANNNACTVLSDSEDEISELGFDMDEVPNYESLQQAKTENTREEVKLSLSNAGGVSVEPSKPGTAENKSLKPAVPPEQDVAGTGAAAGATASSSSDAAGKGTEDRPPEAADGGKEPRAMVVAEGINSGGAAASGPSEESDNFAKELQQKLLQQQQQQHQGPRGSSSASLDPIPTSFPRYSESAVFSRLYTDFVSRLERMRDYRDEICSARQGVLLKIYEAQRKIVEFLEPHAPIQEDDFEDGVGAGNRLDNLTMKMGAGGNSRGGGHAPGASLRGRRGAGTSGRTSTYFAEFVTLLKNQESGGGAGGGTHQPQTQFFNGGGAGAGAGTSLNNSLSRPRQQSLPDILQSTKQVKGSYGATMNKNGRPANPPVPMGVEANGNSGNGNGGGEHAGINFLRMNKHPQQHRSTREVDPGVLSPRRR
mmetsp:Transcript_5043/g.12729  ORF Transcript_5043/g.12729 Transcript_5043/m.12729 type:complete len:1425 (+) Transcript_5043:112-4386(+)|eukprot:CAMPEP_0178992542 /NCGR_PEP_ID=MMETSP0795-20121207/6174_1 /TAXON_ID=88552 /ORGANISM="Amoebophrya sp., Strain Ameob2" /LENGTH=1424 /DNA_ID=CAMNT_0020684439 /DNA_START=39 /DNA_END=4313 /DNA_ORIENTATION=+